MSAFQLYVKRFPRWWETQMLQNPITREEHEAEWIPYPKRESQPAPQKGVPPIVWIGLATVLAGCALFGAYWLALNA